MLLLTVCAACREVGPSPCDACRASLRPAPALPAPPGVDELSAAMAYEGAGRELVARLKYRNERAALAWLADRMAAVAPSGADTITWAPTTSRRRRRRGFDHAELLAKAVARRLDVPCRRLLVRGAGPAQTGRGRAERWAGPRLAARWPVAGAVLVVDDVCTSGATLAAAAAALRGAGASRVIALTAARTRAIRPARPLKVVVGGADL